MGRIVIRMEGSFTYGGEIQFSAEEGGHTLAIQRAIGWLIDRQQSAIIQDHRLHAAGTHPPLSGFGKLHAPLKKGG